MTRKMRFLGIGDSCDLASLYLRLSKAGHEVKVSIANPACRGALAGMVEHAPDWRSELDWIKAAGPQGVLLFENVAYGRGAAQDALRAAGYNVIGGSAYGDRLENDRAYAQGVLAELGLPILKNWSFTDGETAIDFISERPARYVLKFNGPGFASSDNYVGRSPDGGDVKALIAALRPQETAEASFILMEHASGVEMGVGAYFDGKRFLTPACLDWEHKRFFPGDLGELTGEMGTVVTYERSARFFQRTLGKMEALLRAHHYLGYINLNTIVNEAGVWPLEFTCRFGYPGYAILEALQITPWAELFAIMTGQSAAPFETRPGFAVGVVLTTPPFPYTRLQIDAPIGLPVLFEDALSDEDDANYHLGEVGMAADGLVTSGIYGWTMVATGRAATIAEAQTAALARAARVLVPNLRYRQDIGDRLRQRELAMLEHWSLLGD